MMRTIVTVGLIGSIIAGGAGCSSGDDDSGAAGSGGSSAQGGSGAQSGSGGSSAQGGTGGNSGDFAACTASNKPDTPCVQAALCLEASCGLITSELDENGCVRKACSADSDCSDGELCFPGPVVAQVDATTPRFSLSCTQSGTRCDCTGKDVTTGAGAYCVSRTTALNDWGCMPSTSITKDCTKLSAWIAGATSFLSSLTLYSSIKTGATSCITQAQQKYDAMCK